MLSLPHVWHELESKGDILAHYERTAFDALQRYRVLLDRLAALDRDEVLATVADIARPGARPSRERRAGVPVVRPFNQRWENHEQARAWALTVLRDTPTIAVDGSQIAPSRDVSLPVGAVQVAWFENSHVNSGRYVKMCALRSSGPTP